MFSVFSLLIFLYFFFHFLFLYLAFLGFIIIIILVLLGENMLNLNENYGKMLYIWYIILYYISVHIYFISSNKNVLSKVLVLVNPVEIVC